MSTNLLSFKAALIKGKLPILDATLSRFKMLMDRPATTNQHLAEIIRSDIGYTLAVFRTVNATLAKGRDPIDTIDHAISMLGIAKIADIGKKLVPFSALEEKPRQALAKIYSSSFHAAQYFEALAMQQKLPLIEENAKAIKLMSLAQVALWTNNPDAIQSHNPESAAALIVDFKEPLDSEMRELALELAIAWALPETLKEALSSGFAAYTVAVSMTIADGIAHSQVGGNRPVEFVFKDGKHIGGRASDIHADRLDALLLGNGVKDAPHRSGSGHDRRISPFHQFGITRGLGHDMLHE